MAGEVNLTGKLASLIESGAGVVVSRMTKEFSAQLIERCAAGEASVPAREPGGGPMAASPPASTSRTLARWRDWWTRLLRGRRAGRGTSVQPSQTQEATSGNATAQ
jgi:hypothetical protein